jgi:hypothetical protein
MTTRTTLPALTAVLALAFALAAVAQDGGSPPKPNDKPSVEQLIDRLNSDDFQTRQQATRDLIEREDTESALMEALKSDSAEVQSRAETILAERKARLRKRHVARAVELANNGGVDLFAEAMAAVGDPGDDQAWAAMLALTRRVVKGWQGPIRGAGFQFPEVNRLRDEKPEARNWNGLIDYEDLSARRFVAGDLTGRNHINQSLFVAKGRVEARGRVVDSVFIATGDVKLPELPAMRSILICDGNVEVWGTNDCLIFASGTIKTTKLGFNKEMHVPNLRDLYGVARFFDPAQVGVEAAESEGGLTVKIVADGKPFARAGLRAGDRLRAVDGVQVSTTDAFRRALRRAIALAKQTVLTVERDGGRPTDLKVSLAD